MDQVEDDEVVFEGSELHKYLENIGVASGHYLCFDRKNSEEIYIKNETFISCKMITDYKHKIVNYLNSIQKYIITKPELPCPCCREYCQSIVEADVLTQDDATFITNCLPNELFQEGKSSFSYKLPFKLFAIGIILLAFFGNKYFLGDIYSIFALTATNVCIFLLGVYCLMDSIRYWNYAKAKIAHQNNVKILHKILEICSSLQKLNRKSVLLIQEFELVARGFTLILPQISPATLDRKSPSSKPIQCPALRKIILSSSTDSLNIFRKATLHLLNSYKLSSGIDHIWHYIASIPLSEYKSMEIMSEESIDDIKHVWHLSFVQMSEFFRRLCLSLSPDSYGENYPKSDKLEIFWSFRDVLSPVISHLEPILAQTEQSYQFHRKATNLADSELKNKRNISKENDFHNAVIGVHSLALHLQSALSRVIHLENELENEPAKNDDEFYASCSHHLQSVQMELNSCLSCHEETKKQIDILCGKKAQTPKLTDGIKINSLMTLVNQTEPIPLFEMGDPISEDQVFEAYVSDGRSSGSDSDDDVIVEREERKRQKETSKSMMSELKCILTVKASEWQEREAKALARSPRMITSPSDSKEIKSTDVSVVEENDVVNDARLNVDVDKNQSISCVDENANDDDDSSEENQNNIIDSKPIYINDNIRDNIEQRMQQYSPASRLGFTASIAAMAAARSRQINFLPVETFSDSEHESD